jgi:hypothetical protein
VASDPPSYTPEAALLTPISEKSTRSDALDRTMAEDSKALKCKSTKEDNEVRVASVRAGRISVAVLCRFQRHAKQRKISTPAATIPKPIAPGAFEFILISNVVKNWM